MKVGSIVLCVNDSNWQHDNNDCFNMLPVKGNLYKISAIYPHYGRKNGPPGVSVEGIIGKIRNIKTYWGEIIPCEWQFKIRRFKDIGLLSDDINQLNEIDIEELITQTEYT